MKLFKKSSTTSVNTPARIKRMSTHELQSWGGVLVMHLGANYDSWVFHNMSAEEFKMNLKALSDLVEELESRENDRRN